MVPMTMVGSGPKLDRRRAPWAAVWLWILLVLSLLPYLCLAFFAHPVADDFCYAAKSAGEDLWTWSRGEWLSWNGRYASNLLMIHGPLTWCTEPLTGYRLMPPALLLLTLLSAWFLLHRLARHALSGREELLGALVFLLLYLNLMPDVGEGFYWYTGAITYQLGSILLLIHLGLLVPLHQKGFKRFILFLLNLLLAFLIAGMNEIHMLLLFYFHLGRTILFVGRRKAFLPALLLLLVTGTGAALMYLAPGNAVRGAMFADTHLLWRSVGMSGLQSLRFIGTWLLSPSLLAMGLLYVPLHGRLKERIPGYKRLLRIWPWTAALLPFAVVAATTFPAYWSTGLLGQHRTLNVACLFFIPLFFLNLAVWLERKPLQRLAIQKPNARMEAWALALALLALNLTGNGFAAHADLLGGRAAAYDRVMTAREDQLEAAANDPTTKVVFTHQVVPPRTLPSYEGQYELRDWMMQCQARFYGAESSQVELVQQ
jgi:hypothetical protein